MHGSRGARGALDIAGVSRLQGGVFVRALLRRFVGLTLIALVLSALAGCETVGYYGQAIRGQAELLLARQRVADLIADPATPPALGTALRTSVDVLAFAESELGIAADGRYQSYVDLDRRAVVYNVFASPPYTLAPVQWCFPIAGCVSYRGYFARADARAKADALAAEGFDVHVGGVAAYSTLGWFDDPLLSTFIDRGDAALAELLFHELAHGVVYVPGDTAFNESFATFVGRKAVAQFLASRGDGEMLDAWVARNAARERFVALTLALRTTLAEGYAELLAEHQDEAARRAGKAALWAALRAEWRAQRDDALVPYDGFFEGDASNARLNTVADYNVHLPAFAALHDAQGADWARFFERVRILAADDAARARFTARAD